MIKFTLLLMGAAAYLGLLHYEHTIALGQVSQLQKLYTSSGDQLLATTAANR